MARLFWDDVADRITALVKSLIDEFLEARRTEVLGASSYERSPSRNGHRGGSYARRLKTKWGEVEVRVPRVAGGTYGLEIIEFPTEDHKKIRTTNALERAFREVRRRTRPMGVYVNTASADRIMFGVTEEMNERWRGAPQLAKSAS